MLRQLTQDRSRLVPVLAVIAIIVVAVPVLLLTSGGGAGSTAAPASGDAVTIANFEYMPPEITVKAGTEVTWANEDSAPHTASADDGSFDTGTIEEGGNTGSVTLDTPGTFSYFCSFHAFMKGSVTVEE